MFRLVPGLGSRLGRGSPSSGHSVQEPRYLVGVTDPNEAVRLVANDYLVVFEADRAVGCPQHEFLPIKPQVATVAGRPGLRYGFSLFLNEGETDRALQHAVVEGGTLSIIAAEARDEGSCLSAEGTTPFSTTALDESCPG